MRRRLTLIALAAGGLVAAGLALRRPPRSGIEWVVIPGGSFSMGSARGKADERPVHRVTLESFEMAKTPVTFKQYHACVAAGGCTPELSAANDCFVFDASGWHVGNLPQAARGDDQPAICLDWAQAAAYSRWAGGRLPSEAQWEYAARGAGGSRTYPWGEDAASCRFAVLREGGAGCGRGSDWPVCSRPEGNTAQGLCDMAGNVMEWTEDWYHASYEGAPSDGSAWETPGGRGRVLRGGSFYDDGSRIRTTSRDGSDPANHNDIDAYVGFRPVRAAR